MLSQCANPWATRFLFLIWVLDLGRGELFRLDTSTEATTASRSVEEIRSPH
jgi:hypothetical protein